MPNIVEMIAAPNLSSGGQADDLNNLVAKLTALSGAEVLKVNTAFVTFKAPESDVVDLFNAFDGKLLFELNADLQMDPPSTDFSGGPAGPSTSSDVFTIPLPDDEGDND